MSRSPYYSQRKRLTKTPLSNELAIRSGRNQAKRFRYVMLSCWIAIANLQIILPERNIIPSERGRYVAFMKREVINTKEFFTFVLLNTILVKVLYGISRKGSIISTNRTA